ASTQVLVLPLPQPVLGTVSVTPGQPSPSPIAPGNTDFPFVLVSNANLPATYTATITIQGVPWQSLAQLLDLNKVPIQNNQIPLTPGQPVTVNIRIAIPAGTDTTPFSLGLAVASGQQSGGTSGLTNYTVGQSGPVQDNTITLTFGSSNPATAVSGQTIQVAQGAIASLTFVSAYTVPGIYTISVTLIQATNWLVAITQPEPPNPPQPTYVLTLTAAQIQAGGGSATQNLIFALKPETAATNGKVQFTIQNAGVTGNQSTTYELTVQ